MENPKKKRCEWTFNNATNDSKKTMMEMKYKGDPFKGQRKVIEMVFKQRRTNLSIIAVSEGGKIKQYNRTNT